MWRGVYCQLYTRRQGYLKVVRPRGYTRAAHPTFIGNPHLTVDSRVTVCVTVCATVCATVELVPVPATTARLLLSNLRYGLPVAEWVVYITSEVKVVKDTLYFGRRVVSAYVVPCPLTGR